MTELRRMALEQFAKEQAREELQEQRHLDSMTKHLQQVFFETFLLQVKPTSHLHEVDGLKFTVSGDNRNSTLYLVEKCHICETELLIPIVSLAALGQHLETQEEEPVICGVCQMRMEESQSAGAGQEPVLTEAEAVVLSLGSALRQAILMAEVLEGRVLPTLTSGENSFHVQNNTQE